MSLNDKDALTGPKGEDIVDGMRNFTESNNPARENEEINKGRYDAWAASGQRGLGSGEAGVAEAGPGILDGSKIAPLEPNKVGDTDDFAAGAGSTAGSETTAQASSAFSTLAGAAKQAYGAATGDSSLEAEGKKQYEGTS